MNCWWLSDPGSLTAALSVTYSSLNPSALVRPWMPSPSTSSLTQAFSKKGTHKAENQLCFKCQHGLAPTGCQKLNILQSLKTILLSWQSMAILPLLHFTLPLLLQMESKHWTANWLGKDFKNCRNPDKFPSKVWACLSLDIIPAAKNPNKLIQPCSLKSFEGVNYSSKQKSGANIFSIENIFLW